MKRHVFFLVKEACNSRLLKCSNLSLSAGVDVVHRIRVEVNEA